MIILLIKRELAVCKSYDFLIINVIYVIYDIRITLFL